MLSCSIWFSAPSFWMGGGLESCCVGRVYGVDGAVHSTIRTVHTTYDLGPTQPPVKWVPWGRGCRGVWLTPDPSTQTPI